MTQLVSMISVPAFIDGVMGWTTAGCHPAFSMPANQSNKASFLSGIRIE